LSSDHILEFTLLGRSCIDGTRLLLSLDVVPVMRKHSRTGKGVDMTDTRTFLRYAVRFDCLIGALRRSRRAKDKLVQATTRNMSTGGLFITTAGVWEIGSRLTLDVHIPIRSFGSPMRIRCIGKVVRVEDGAGVAVAIKSYRFVTGKVEMRRMYDLPIWPNLAASRNRRFSTKAFIPRRIGNGKR
jgi:hypothetical protein